MSNPTELPDLDKLEALADAMPEHLRLKGWYVAAPSFGQQHVYADNFKGQGRQHVASLPAHKTYFAGLAEFIAAFDPATVKHLIALARRAQPEGEAPQADMLLQALIAVCNAALPVTNTAYNLGQGHEQWESIKKCIATLDNARIQAHELIRVVKADIPPAANLSPLCGAQHAESGKEEDVGYELHQDDMLVAGVSGQRAYEEILHYAAQYVQDGPVELYKVVRTKLDIPHAAQLDGGQEGSTT